MSNVFIDDSNTPMTIEEVCKWFDIDPCDSIQDVADKVIRNNDGVKTLHTLWCDGVSVDC